MSGPVVDIHCHNFNGDDLPVRGFIQRVDLRHVPIGSTLSMLLDALVQEAAPGYHQDTAKLDQLLGQPQLESTFGVEAVQPPEVDVEAQLEQEVEQALSDLQGRNPALVQRVGLELTAAETPEAIGEVGAEGVLDLVSSVRRAIKWVKIFAKSRLDISALLASTFKEVDLFTPMLVDMGASLGDLAPTTMRQQVELQEKISRLSMLGFLPGVGKARFHPFVGFDPRAEAKARAVPAIDTPFEVVQAAVERFGCIGVKVYPPMGWRPIGNRAGGDMSASEAVRVDEALRDLYTYCQAKDVPITAHCNDSNYAADFYRKQGFAGPAGWLDVLKEFPNLHLNLGHFGGAHQTEPPDGWPHAIAVAAGDFPHLYVDVANHNIYDEALSTGYLDSLERMFSDPQTQQAANRIMYGSDWYMVALHPDYEDFLHTYRQLFEQRFGVAAGEAFMGSTALNFLFGTPGERTTNMNADRLRARYEKYAGAQMPGWVGG